MSQDPGPAIVTHQLTRRFGAHVGCEGISLSVPRGGIFSLLGCNGAGKSTFVKMLLGLIRPTSGSARVLGHDPGEIEMRRSVGFLPETFRYPEWATGVEVLQLHAALADVPPARRRGRIATVLDMAGLGAAGRRLVGGYSKGMQQRLGLACALLADPPLIFLDEPTSALDPLGRRQVREILGGLRAEGKTIFLNSHLLSEVEMVSDRVAVIRRGRLVAAGTLGELLEADLEAEVLIRDDDAAADRAVGSAATPLGRDPAPGGLVRVRVALARREDAAALASAVVQAGGQLFGLRVHARTLEDVFVELVAGSAPAEEEGT